MIAFPEQPSADIAALARPAVPAQGHPARHQAAGLAAGARRRRRHARPGPRGDPGRLRLVELPPPRVRGRPHPLRRPRPRRGLGRPAKGRARTASTIAKEGESFRYTYDFGDDWKHKVTVEKIAPPDPGDVPACIDGRRACPPEDCGGTWGYRELLEILADPTHPEHAERVEWASAAGPSTPRPSTQPSSRTTSAPSASPASTTEPRPVPLTEPVPRSAPASVRQAGGWRDAARRLPDRVPRGLRGGRCYVPSCPRRCR